MIKVDFSIRAYLFILPKKYCNVTFGGYLVEKGSSGLNSIFEFCPDISVKIVDIDPIRGYAIEDKHGNMIVEIGWTI